MLKSRSTTKTALEPAEESQNARPLAPINTAISLITAYFSSFHAYRQSPLPVYLPVLDRRQERRK